MTAVVVVGAQWGDEGKGKIVDFLAESADVVARYAGGPNAGHTLVVGGAWSCGCPTNMERWPKIPQKHWQSQWHSAAYRPLRNPKRKRGTVAHSQRQSHGLSHSFPR